MSWQRTRKIVPQALISAIYGFGDILAGTILWMYFPSDVGWAAILYPPLMGARGAIAGSIVGRLTSSLNIGIVEPNWSRGNERLWEIISTGVSASLLASVMVLAPFLFISTSAGFLTLIFVSLITVSGSTLLLIPLNLLVSFEVFKRGLDPDIVVYPLMSTAADVVVTALYIYSVRAGTKITSMVALLVLGVSIAATLK
ncbi:MAG TPA: hypothetical protein ENF57_00235, partial [Candidatus Korarchaeota archaeon]|nr:hypothetical protein [Candidatus Korarchaeota archaeon]